VHSWQVRLDERVVAELSDRVIRRPGRALVVHGPSGIGKTAMVAEVSRRVEAAGFSTVPIVGMAELRSLPLAVIGPVLALAGADPMHTATDRMQRLFSQLARDAAHTVLVIDDGPFLDDISASAIYQLVRVLGLRCIMTARDEQSLPTALQRLENEGFVERTALAALSIADSRVLVEAALGGEVEADSMRWLTTMAAGNPLFLRELLLAAERQGSLRRGEFGIEIDTRRLPPGMRAAASERLATLSEPQRALASLIAVAEPWLEVQLGEPAVLAELDELQLIERTSTSRVRLAHPVLAEVLLSELPGARLDTLRIAAAERLSGEGDDQRFRVLCLLVDTSTPPEPTEIAWAASYAEGIGDHPLAVRLASMVLRNGELFPALLTSGIAFSAMGRLAEADDAFERAVRVARGDEERAAAASRHGDHLCVRRLRSREAVELGQATLATIADETARAALEVYLDRWRVLAGETPAPASEVDPGESFESVIFRATVSLVRGDLDGVRDAIAGGCVIPDVARQQFPHACSLLNFTEFFLLAFEGRTADAVALAELHGGDPFDEVVGTWSYGLALLALHDGRAEEALELSTLAVRQLHWRDISGSLGAATALRASAAAQLGRRELATESLAAIPAGLDDVQGAEATAWMLAQDGHTDAAADVLVNAVRRGIELGQHGLAAYTLHVAVRLGAAALLAPETAQIASVAQGRLVAAICAHADAVVARDPAALLLAASELAATGSSVGAVSAARSAAELFDYGSEGRRKAELIAARYAEGLSGWRPDLRRDRSTELSERELAIARAAAGRESSREIAERMGISARTVDNHLRNVYRKLGVAGRRELRDALAE